MENVRKIYNMNVLLEKILGGKGNGTDYVERNNSGTNFIIYLSVVIKCLYDYYI